MNKNILTSSVILFSVNILNAQNIELDDVTVVEKKITNNTITREKIQNQPTQNGSLSEILKQNPHVRLSNTQSTSQNLGDIATEDISINGGVGYQNNFMINNFNINNDLNPGGQRFGVGQNTTHVKQPDISSISQGISIDADLVDSVEVYDSDVSARYGNFMGGVVNAKTRDPKKKLSGKISLTHSNNNWVSYKVEDKEKLQNSTSPNMQPKFKKQIFRTSLEGYLSENFGLIGSYTQTYSTIPIKYDPKYFSDAFSTKERKMHRKNENFFLSGIYKLNDTHVIRPTLIYTPTSATYYTEFMKDSLYDYKGDGLVGSVNVKSDFENVNLEQNFGYSNMKSSRLGSKDYQVTWNLSKLKNWAAPDEFVVQEGTFASVEQEQKSFDYSFDLEFEKVKFYDSLHAFSFGGEISRKSGKLSYKDGWVSEGSPNELYTSCKLNDSFCVEDGYENPYDEDEIGHGQWHDFVSRYNGKTKKDVTNYAIYLQDSIKYKNLTTRFGLRLDKDDFMNNYNYAPRFSTKYDIFGDASSVFSFGANRYYGRNSFSYALKEGTEWLQTQYTRDDPNGEWKLKKDDYKSNYKYSSLKTPYTNELSFGIYQDLKFLNIEAKYINRKDKNAIMTTWRSIEGLEPNTNPKYEENHRVLTNNGKGKTDVYSLVIQNNNPLNFISGLHNFELIFDYTDINRNYNSYNDTTQDKERGNRVIYNGEVTHIDSIPRYDFNIPWTLKLNTYSGFNTNFGLVKFNNFFTINSSYDGIEYKGFDFTQFLDKYESKHFGTSFTWDARIGLEVNHKKGISYFANLDILNILNKKIPAGTNYNFDTENSSTLYKAGRQFWLEIGAKF